MAARNKDAARQPGSPTMSVALNRNVVINEDGHAAIFGPLLRHMLLIYELYKSRNERITGITDLPAQRKDPCYEVDLLSSAWASFTVKVRVTDGAITEYAREALDD